MDKGKNLIRQAVLASLLAFNWNNAVWAAEGVDQPFSTVSELEALGGIASITSGNIYHTTKGIYASGEDFIYNSGAIKLDISGFANAENTGVESIGIFGFNGTTDLKQIEMNFTDASGSVNNLDVYGVKTYSSGVVKMGDGSKITIYGDVSGKRSSSQSYGMKGLYAGNNGKRNPGIIEVGDDFELSVTNIGDGWVFGIDSYDGASITVGDNLKLFVSGQNETRGVEVGYNNASAALGKAASIDVYSEDGTATGIFVLNSPFFGS